MNVDFGAPYFAYLHGRTVLRILFPRISKKATHLLHTVILTDTHRATPHPHHSIPGMYPHTASIGTHGHRTHANVPCLYMQAGVGFLDVFGAGQWPCMLPTTPV